MTDEHLQDLVGLMRETRELLDKSKPTVEDAKADDFTGWFDTLASAGNEDAVFDLLDQPPPVSKLLRQKLRGQLISVLDQKFKNLGSRVSAAKTADAWLESGSSNERSDNLQGQSFIVEEIEPWGASVAGADVLDETAVLIDAYLWTTPEKRDALALWIAYTHVFDCFGLSPYMDLSSPTMRCGKSTAAVLCRHLCPRPLMSGNITPAALFRSVQAWKPTLLVDEADTFATMHDELRGIFNAGHTRDTAYTVRAEGDANEPRLFSTWAPKLIAAIGRLPGTIEDRCIRIVLTRKPVNVKKRDAFDPNLVREDCGEVRQRLARFAHDNEDRIAAADVQRPDGLNDRAWNNWRPLLSVAAVAGGDWPDRAVTAALAISGDEGEGAEVEYGVLALQHIWEVLEPAGRLATADILTHLVSKEEGPWAKWWEAQVAKNELKSPAARLAKLLKPFEIKPAQVWVEGQNVRGYDADWFRTETVLVYLPPAASPSASPHKDVRDVGHVRHGTSKQAEPNNPNDPNDFLGDPQEGVPPPPDSTTTEDGDPDSEIPF